MRNYEMMLIYDVDEKPLDQILEYVRNFFNSHKVEITSEKDYGMKDLAYLINKKRRGHFYLFNIKTDQDNLQKINKDFKLYKPIVRYIMINKES